MKPTTIHVFLPRENSPVWAPVDAEHLFDDVYRIVDCRGEEEEVEFGRGVVVHCRLKHFGEDEGNPRDVLVAFEAVSSN